MPVFPQGLGSTTDVLGKPDIFTRGVSGIKAKMTANKCMQMKPV